MAIYKCAVCGAIYDEEKEGTPLSSLPLLPGLPPAGIQAAAGRGQ